LAVEVAKLKFIADFFDQKDMTMFLRRATPFIQLVSAVYFLTCLPACKPAPALEVLIMSGDATPDGQSQFNVSLESNVAINGDYISLSTKLKNNHDVIVVNKNGGKSKIVIETGMTTPSGHTLSWAGGGSLVVNQDGLTAVLIDSALSSNPNASKTELLSAEYSGALNFLISDGDIEPEGNGDMSVWTGPLSPSINSKGQIAASIYLANSTDGSVDNGAIFRVDNDTGVIRKIVRKGENIPVGTGQFAGTWGQSNQIFYNPLTADDGSVAFLAAINNGDVYGATGIYVGNGSEITEVARYGDVMPGDYPLNIIWGMDYSPSGLIAFTADISGSSYQDAVYLYLENSIYKIADMNNTAENGDNILPAREVKVSDSGQVAFIANLYQSGTSGIFVGNTGGLTQIAIEGDAAPEGHGIFQMIRTDYSMSDNGLVAFEASYNNNGKTQEAIYYYDNKTLQEVVSTVDTIDGSAVVHLDLGGLLGAQSEAINEAGDIVFKFQLADGRIGVAVWRH